ncbi:MAG: signal peptide peptidase SppA [Planctomycetota bacterium]|nr:signal peptide peptidase SppA [Planctomycetota bacterium]
MGLFVSIRMWVVVLGLLAALPLAGAQAAGDARRAPIGLAKGSAKNTAKAAHPVPDKSPKAPVAAVRMVGWIEISGNLRDAPPAFSLAGISENGKLTLRRVLDKIHQVGVDKQYIGLVIHLDEADLEMSQIDELAQAIRDVRAAGRKVFVFSEAYDLHSYILACAADRVLILKKGLLELEGMAIEEMYLAGLLEKVGAKADFLQIGKYKGAEEPLTRKGPSPEWSQNFDGLLDDIYSATLDRIAAARKITREQVEKALADCWSMSDQQYVERKLVDDLVDRDLIDVTEREFGQDFDWDDMLAPAAAPSMENPFAVLQMLFHDAKPTTNRQSIALIHASGEIVSGDGSGNGGLFGGESLGSHTLIDALGQAQDDELIRGVVLRIDSPGGSALASELMWQAVRELGQTKPVYVSIGAMAASGGYYIACGGDRIYVTPSSIVGSIGVVGGKIVLGGLYEKIGVSVFRRSRGPLGDMFNSVQPFTPEQRTALQSAFERTYEQFLDRVRTGRGKHIKDLSAVAQGRIFSGRQAVANGLADKVGGVEVALADLASDLKLKPGSYDIISLPAPMTLPEYLQRMFEGLAMGDADGGNAMAAWGGGPAAIVQTAKAALGPRAWRAARPVLSGLMLLRSEPVLTLFPTAVRVR